ncbi:40S ribosomal protein S11, putative [Leishmania tarentolae]|uniref:40S ribosomal protein S11, putative n=1 Tax=Leishmania tarentolae TaxID=5689 RepID=A0A640KET2_LEITA|nr:40S ribosomal protein S11, putative [Leishmania tarentolae]
MTRMAKAQSASFRLVLGELLAHLVGGALRHHLQDVVADRLAQRAALTNDDLITLLRVEGRAAVHGQGLVALLVPLVLLDEVQVVAADDDGAVHLGGVHNTAQDAAADHHVAREGALAIDVLAIQRLRRCLEAQTNLLGVADVAGLVDVLATRAVHVLIHRRLALVRLLVLDGGIHRMRVVVLGRNRHGSTL